MHIGPKKRTLKRKDMLNEKNCRTLLTETLLPVVGNSAGRNTQDFRCRVL